jgi:hypothetical protein
MHVLSSLSIGFSRRPINIVRNQGHLAYNNNGGRHCTFTSGSRALQMLNSQVIKLDASKSSRFPNSTNFKGEKKRKKM